MPVCPDDRLYFRDSHPLFFSFIFIDGTDTMRALSLVSLLSPALAATSGTFNVLSFNVAGLPEIINGNDVPGDKTENTKLIGERFAEYGYDVIHVQEVRPLT